MTKTDFEHLHTECSAALTEYARIATSLCMMLEDCGEQRLNAEQRSAIALQRRQEIEIFSEYQKVRDRLLHAARVGFGSID